jgi:hypothetical protein
MGSEVVLLKLNITLRVQRLKNVLKMGVLITVNDMA